MEKKFKISILTPTYNRAELLKRLYSSLVKNCKENLEIEWLIMDDGSKDGSGKICDQLVAKDTRIKVIHKTNGGICSARNAGLKEAAGEYIAF